MRVNKKIRLIIILILIIGMFLLPYVTTSPPAQVSVFPSNQTLAPGETFDLAILIDPMGTYIAGAKLNIEFNRDMLKVNKISEGNLFKQNGANTFFNGGVVNNPDGMVTNIYDAIIGKSNVSNPGTFITINLTVINSSGSAKINISNVEISDPNGFLIAVNVINGTINDKITATGLPWIRFINGTVMDGINKTGISGVTVSTNNSPGTTTDKYGSYSLMAGEGTYNLTSRSDPLYYTNNTIMVSTIGREVVLQDVELNKKPTGTISGAVTNS